MILAGGLILFPLSIESYLVNEKGHKLDIDIYYVCYRSICCCQWLEASKTFTFSVFAGILSALAYKKGTGPMVA